MSNLNKKIFLFIMVVGLALGLVGCTDAENSVRILFDQDEYSVKLSDTKTVEPTIIKSSAVGEVKLVYSSSDESVVKYVNGELIPVSEGVATVKAAWADKDIIFDKITVTVLKAALPSAVITCEDEMLKGAKQTVKVELVKNLSEATYSFKAITPEIATISEDGEIVALAVGTAKFEVIVADREESETTSFEVTVNKSEYAIAYELNGGVNAESNPAEYSTLEDTAIAAPSKEGYTFEGWTDESNNKVEMISKGTTGSVKLTANWKAVEYAITVNGVEGATFAEGYSLPTSYTIESEEIVLGNASKDAYTFLGYFNAKDEKVEKIAKGSMGAVELTAKWELVTYTITYKLEGGALQTLEEVGAALFADFYSWLGLTEGAETFFKGADGTAKAGGWYANKAKLYAAGKPGVGEAECFINDPVYNAKWIGFFNALDACVTEVNSAQSFWASAWTGNIRLAEVWDNATRFSDAQDAKLVAAAPLPVPTSYTFEDAFDFENPSKVGYNFVGWFAGTDKVTGIAEGSMGNLEVVASWEAIEYTIASWDFAGGENVQKYLSFKKTAKADLCAEFIADFNKVTGKSVTAADQLYGVGNVYGTFFEDSAMFKKWSWILEYFYDLGEEGIGFHSASQEMYKTFLEGKGTTVSSQWAPRQNIQGFFTETKCGKYSGAAAIDFTSADRASDYLDYIPLNPLFAEPVLKFTIEKMAKVPAPVKEHYIFLGWYEGETKVEKFELRDYETITAKWEAIPKYDLSWDLNGGAWATAEFVPVTVFYKGDEVSMPADPVWADHKFLGWFEGETKVESINEASHALVAKWKEIIHYSINWELDGGVLPEGTVLTASFTEDDTVTLPTPSKKYFEFLGWFEGETKVESIELMNYAALTANWKDLRITGTAAAIMFNLDGGAFPEGQNPYVNNALLVDILNLKPIKEGFKFNGWQQVADNETTPTTTVWTALWIATNFTISWDLAEGAFPEGVVPTTEFEKDEAVAMPADPTREGYKFLGWFEGETKVEAIANHNYELVAKWEKLTVYYDVNYDLDGGVWEGKTIATFAAQFIADFQQYAGNTDTTLAGFHKTSHPAIKTAFANAEMLAKYKWLFELELADLTANFNKEENAAYTVEKAEALELLGKLINGDVTAIGGSYANGRSVVRSWLHGLLNEVLPAEANGGVGYYTAISTDFSLLANKQMFFAAYSKSAMIVKTGEVEENTDLPIPVKLGYEFDGWYDGETKVVKATSDVSVKAKWLKPITQEDLDKEVEALATASAHGTSWTNTLAVSKLAGVTTEWSYKDGEDATVYDCATNAKLKEMLKVCTRTLNVKVVCGALSATKEVVVNFGMLEEGQTGFFYRGDAYAMSHDEPANPKASWIGWSRTAATDVTPNLPRYTIVANSKVLFVAGRNVKTFDSIDALKAFGGLSWSSCLGLFLYNGADATVNMSELPAGCKNAVSGTYVIREGKVAYYFAGGTSEGAIDLKTGDAIFAAQYLDRLGASDANLNPLFTVSVDGEGATVYTDALAVGDACVVKNWN